MINMSSKVLLFSTFQIVHYLRHLTSSSTDTGQLVIFPPLIVRSCTQSVCWSYWSQDCNIFTRVEWGYTFIPTQLVNNIDNVGAIWTEPRMIVRMFHLARNDFFFYYNFQRVESIIPFIERLNLSFDQINWRYRFFSFLYFLFIEWKIKCNVFFILLFTQKGE